MRKFISLLLCICMALTLTIPTSINANAISDDCRIPSRIPEKSNGLTLNKTATDNGDGTYKIALEAFTTGKVEITQNIVPTDLVIVLDQSVSMTNNFGNIQRQKAMKLAVKKFINSVAANAVSNKINHRIAIVTFGSWAKTQIGFTEVYNSNIPNQHAKGRKALNKAVKHLPRPNGATRVDLGIRNAESILNNNKNDSNRNRIVILFTDGVPTTHSQYNINVANNAISTAKRLKDNKTKIYTIGIFDGANPSEMYGSGCNGNIGSNWLSIKEAYLGPYLEAEIPAANRFLNLISSNFDNATSVGLSREYGQYQYFGKYYLFEKYTILENFNRISNNYYLKASNQNELSDVFTEISNTVTVPIVNLGKETVIKDIVSDYFDLPFGTTASNINIYTKKYEGNNNWAKRVATNKVITTLSGKEVNVTGYDFSANCVTQQKKADGTYGQKLIIEFNIVPKTQFIGGNKVPTNNPTSGVYANGQVVKNFVLPLVDVPIDYDFNIQNQSIYVSQNAELKKLFDENTGFKPNGKNNAFVDITYTVKQGNKTIGIYKIPAGKSTGNWNNSSNLSPELKDITNYTVECKVSPKKSGKNESWVNLKNATVYVFEPRIKTENSMVNYNENIDLNENVSADWICEIEDAEIPLSGEPELSYEITDKDTTNVVNDETNYDVKKESNMKVTKVSANGVDVTENTIFEPTAEEFSIGINKFDLVINKTVNGEQTINQNFIISVKDEEGKVFNVTVTPYDFKDRKATKTIKGLYCGMNYVVSEDNNWSWRYSTDINQTNINEQKNGATKSIDVTNVLKNNKWLSAQAIAKNTFNTVWSAVTELFD